MSTKIDGLLKVDGTTSKYPEVAHGVRIGADCVRRVDKHIALLLGVLRGWVAAVVIHLPNHMILTH